MEELSKIFEELKLTPAEGKTDRSSEEDPGSDEPAPKKKRREDGDDDEADGSSTEELDLEDLAVVLRLFAENRDQYKQILYAKLAKWFGSLSSEKPGDGIFFANKKTVRQSLLPTIMFKLRGIVELNPPATEWNFVYETRYKQSATGEKITLVPGQSMSMRLSASDTVILFSTRDLACLVVAQRELKKSIASVKPGQRKEKSSAVLSQALTKLEKIQSDTIAELRKLDGSSEQLKSAPYLLQGEPLSQRVAEWGAYGYSRALTPDRSPVAIYFDFEENRLFSLLAEDINVPSAAQLDAAYEKESKHPTRVILRDLRPGYKALRNWN